MQHLADERAVDLLGRDPQDVAGEAGRERAHEVLVLGQAAAARVPAMI